MMKYFLIYYKRSDERERWNNILKVVYVKWILLCVFPYIKETYENVKLLFQLIHSNLFQILNQYLQQMVKKLQEQQVLDIAL